MFSLLVLSDAGKAWEAKQMIHIGQWIVKTVPEVGSSLYICLYKEVYMLAAINKQCQILPESGKFFIHLFM